MTIHVIWSIRAAEARDAEALPTLENSAGTLFRSFPSLEWLADSEDLPVERYRELIAQGANWVAVDPDERPIAFLCGSVEEDELHIWELGVRRDLQRFGIGRGSHGALQGLPGGPSREKARAGTVFVLRAYL